MATAELAVAPEPPSDCSLCPRLVALRHDVRAAEPDWHAAPVPSFGEPNARLLVVGLAPGMQGANRTGRPFTGDWAGDLLYETLDRYGFSQGRYEARPDDGLTLTGCMITNAVRCLPPQNKPVGAEIAACRPFLAARIAALPKLTHILTLGRIAHESTLRALGLRPAAMPFVHGAMAPVAGYTVAASYHCSRYNTNTRRLTPEMFRAVFAALRSSIDD